MKATPRFFLGAALAAAALATAPAEAGLVGLGPKPGRIQRLTSGLVVPLPGGQGHLTPPSFRKQRRQGEENEEQEHP